MGSKISHLEGLRGLAACAVLLSHLKGTFWSDPEIVLSPGSQEGEWSMNEVFGFVASAFLQASSNGAVAVWIFWIISAYALTVRFHAETNLQMARRILTDSAVKRYVRLAIPVLASTMLAWSLHANGWMSNGRLAVTLGPEFTAWLGSFYRFEPSLFGAVSSAVWEAFFAFDGTTTYNSVLWTMSYELYGSFFLFGYLALFGKHRVRVPLYALAATLFWMLKIYWLNAFVFGCAICDAYVNREVVLSKIPMHVRCVGRSLHRSRIVASVCLLSLVIEIGSSGVDDGQCVLLALACSAFVVASPLPRYLLSRRIPVFLGKISFGVYLVHIPIICALAFPIYGAMIRYGSTAVASVLSLLGLVFVSLLGGWIFWRVVDYPTISLANTLAKKMNPSPVTQEEEPWNVLRRVA